MAICNHWWHRRFLPLWTTLDLFQGPLYGFTEQFTVKSIKSIVTTVHFIHCSSCCSVQFYCIVDLHLHCISGHGHVATAMTGKLLHNSTHNMLYQNSWRQFWCNIILFTYPCKGTVFINTRRCSPLCRLTFRSCWGLQPSAEAFFALRAKKGHFTLLVPF